MEGIAGQKASLTWAVHIAVAALVILWTVPTFGLLVSSFRDKDQLAMTGWWTSLSASEQTLAARTEGPDAQIREGDLWVVRGNLFAPAGPGQVASWGASSREPAAFAPGETADLGDGEALRVEENGDYELSASAEMTGSRGQRVYVQSMEPPVFTLDNYRSVIGAEGIGRAFLNTFTVTIPATVIPILVAAFAAYALAWMQFPGRAILVACVVGLLVVPLQLSLIPLLRFHNAIGLGKGYFGIWLAHTGFGLPLAIYLLRNYMSGLPKDIIEGARVDGATDFQIFRRIVLPLSFPALASFAIFQFLWTWNDLLVAKVFLGTSDSQLVMTGRIVELLGSRGGNWEILTAAAFLSIAVPLVVFFAMQKYLVRGLLAGSVK
ncbi:carbohydrate ABC transporter permease [Mangrovicoccus algicola]|uniref:Carbohydrate ABC transporter permease n=1 Tax=Mangrovicoccus algicola TaxID=2771008 RepID=A0A8J6YYR0_9RHOB|nr:carbohydrate ABC transporter permease [Mangrovicoccus algicola]MBE3639079.1 carbohydrate ABC transporter permease [Mangrovicoccus algicola]